jgi:Flp pilus assembly pilin Flp
VLPILIRIHLAIRGARPRALDERGQTSAEYALVLLGAASVALLIALWAKDTDKIGKLLDAIFESITKLVR